MVQTSGGPDEEVKTNKRNIDELKNPTRYTLPDNTSIMVSEEKYLAPEILFNPERIGHSFMGVQEMLLSSITKADIDIRASLFADIYISGAGSKFLGFSTRVLNELKSQKLDNILVMLVE